MAFARLIASFGLLTTLAKWARFFLSSTIFWKVLNPWICFAVDSVVWIWIKWDGYFSNR